MKKIYIYIGALILLSLNILLVINNRKLSEKVSNYNNIIALNNEKSSVIVNELFQKDSLDILLNNMSLRKDLVLKRTDNLITTLKKIADEPKIILRLPELSCKSCFEESLTVFKKFIDKVGDDNVAIITKYQNPRDLFLFKRANNFSCSVYNIIEEGNLGLISKNNTFPFIFILDKSLRSNDLHVIRKGEPVLTKIYLDNIYKKYDINKF